MSKTKEKIKEAITILKRHNQFDSRSKSWAIQRGIDFLETNFNIKNDSFSERDFNAEGESTEQGWSGEL
tara:strand:- start:269 stop:475 length:207 start_codon:yes stop_codon:yes gene_type:complete